MRRWSSAGRRSVWALDAVRTNHKAGCSWRSNLQPAHRCYARRSVGSEVAVVDHVEQALDQFGGLLSLGLGDCHMIIMPEDEHVGDL